LVLAGHVGSMGCSNTIIPERWWRGFVRIRHGSKNTTRAKPNSLLYAGSGDGWKKNFAQNHGS
jgi:hypothetical protein